MLIPYKERQFLTHVSNINNLADIGSLAKAIICTLICIQLTCWGLPGLILIVWGLGLKHSGAPYRTTPLYNRACNLRSVDLGVGGFVRLSGTQPIDAGLMPDRG